MRSWGTATGGWGHDSENVLLTRIESLELRVPVGLDIGADGPAELALSILSEAMAALRGRTGGPLAAR